MKGFLLLTLSASAPGWRRAPCIFGDPKCQPPSIWQLVAFFAALMLMAIGYGGSESCVYAFGADQFDEGNDVEAAQRSSYFNWQYFCSSLGSMIASLFLVYVVNSYGYAIGFAACMLTLILGLTFFFAGTPFYRFQKLQGNPVLHVVQVVVAAVRKRKVNIPPYTTVAYRTCEESSNKVELTNMCTKFRFLEKASVETEGDLGEKDPWHLCEITHVEEVKRFFNLLPLFLSAMIYSIVHIQVFTLFITQGATMDPHFGKFKIPTASLLTFETVAGVIFTLIYEVIMTPLLRKYSSSGQGLANLPRICIGLLLSVLAMLTAAFVERRRLDIVKQFNLYDTTPVPMSVFWQAPQFILVGISEVFAWVGMSEYCYAEAPEGLRSAGSSLFSVAVAAGSFMSTIIIYVVTKLTSHGNGGGWIADNLNMAHLDYFFLLLGGISALNIIYTMFFVRSGKSVEDTFFLDDLHL